MAAARESNLSPSVLTTSAMGAKVSVVTAATAVPGVALPSQRMAASRNWEKLVSGLSCSISARRWRNGSEATAARNCSFKTYSSDFEVPSLNCFFPKS